MFMRYYPYTDKNISVYRSAMAKKINFKRPTSIANLPQSSSSTHGISGMASKTAKYAILAALCAVTATKLSWILALLPKYKLVKVD